MKVVWNEYGKLSHPWSQSYTTIVYVNFLTRFIFGTWENPVCILCLYEVNTDVTANDIYKLYEVLLYIVYIKRNVNLENK